MDLISRGCSVRGTAPVVERVGLKFGAPTGLRSRVKSPTRKTNVWGAHGVTGWAVEIGREGKRKTHPQEPRAGYTRVFL